MAIVTNEEIEALRAGTFELEGLRCTLEQKATAQPHVLVGSGVLNQKPNRALMLKFTCDDPSASSLQPQPVGKFMPPDAYYGLTLVDATGRTWTTDVPGPPLGVHVGPEGVTRFATMPIGRLTVAESVQSDATSLTLYLFRDLDLPSTFGEPSSEELLFGGKHPARRARLTTGPYQVEVASWEVVARVHCVTAGTLASNLEASLLEALQFVAARPVRTAIALKQESGVETTSIEGSGIARRVDDGLPPLRDIWVDGHTQIWSLFATYFEFALSDSPASRGISPILDGVTRAMGGTVDVQALVNSVAVEGMLKHLNSKPARTPEAEAENSAAEMWSAKVLEYLEWEGCPAAVRARIAGRLREFGRKSSADTLRTLADAGVIDHELREAWEAVRHRFAHGFKAVDGDLKKSMLDSEAVLCLLYQLVFDVIGYAGPYEHYGVNGWTHRRYPPGGAESQGSGGTPGV